MARSWIIALMTFAALAGGLAQTGSGKEKEKDKPFRVEGKFSKDDPRDAQRNGPTQIHIVPMKKGKAYTIHMASKNVDSYLRLLDPKDVQIAEDDDSGGMLDAEIVFNCTKDGNYKIVCTTVGADNSNGNYVLTVKTSGAAAQPSAGHAQMLGKGAPDFAADFAINGKPGSLSDFQGKVVLLDFCDVRNSQCIALQAKLRDWHKTYKDQDLAIVSVMFYPSDIGQALTFDAESGAVKTVKTADRKSDRALFSAFAAHHKIEHRMLALSKEDALEAFNAYVVNGFPQVALIDRKGMVRLIDVGGEKGAATVEAELKKLLAEK
jgi:AhpC/TSA family